jgi:hypothetical protein
VISAAAGEIAGLLRLLFGHFAGWIATSVACGHSRRPDCFGKRLGGAVDSRSSRGEQRVGHRAARDLRAGQWWRRHESSSGFSKTRAIR